MERAVSSIYLGACCRPLGRLMPPPLAVLVIDHVHVDDRYSRVIEPVRRRDLRIPFDCYGRYHVVPIDLLRQSL